MSDGLAIPLCWFCKHFRFDGEQIAKDLRRTCTAFPDNIPDKLLASEFGLQDDHRLPHPQDNGIRFEKLDDYTALISRPPFENDTMEEIERKFDKTARALLQSDSRNYRRESDKGNLF